MVTTGLKKVPILEMFGEDGEFPFILHVVARGDEDLPKEYRGYPAFYCLVKTRPERSSVIANFKLEVAHIPSNTTLYLDEKTEVFK